MYISLSLILVVIRKETSGEKIPEQGSLDLHLICPVCQLSIFAPDQPESQVSLRARCKGPGLSPSPTFEIFYRAVLGG